MRDRPDLGYVLQKSFFRTRWGEIGGDIPPWIEVPIFNVFDGGVSTTYVRSAVRKAQLIPEVPRITSLQNEAMNYLDKLAQSSEFHLDMEFQAGDMQFINNHYIMHSRTSYEDHKDWAKKRHLLRLWLACDDGPLLPQQWPNNYKV